MIRNFYTIVLFIVCISVKINATDAEPWKIPYPVEGYWKTMDEESGRYKNRVKLWLHSDTLYGTIETVYNKNVDMSVCEPCRGAFKNKPLEGMRFLWGFVEGNDRYIKGRVIDFQNGRAYKSEISLSEDRDTLYVFSYVNVLIKVGRTQKWVRDK